MDETWRNWNSCVQVKRGLMSTKNVCQNWNTSTILFGYPFSVIFEVQSKRQEYDGDYVYILRAYLHTRKLEWKLFGHTWDDVNCQEAISQSLLWYLKQKSYHFPTPGDKESESFCVALGEWQKFWEWAVDQCAVWKSCLQEEGSWQSAVSGSQAIFL